MNRLINKFSIALPVRISNAFPIKDFFKTKWYIEGLKRNIRMNQRFTGFIFNIKTQGESSCKNLQFQREGNTLKYEAFGEVGSLIFESKSIAKYKLKSEHGILSLNEKTNEITLNNIIIANIDYQNSTLNAKVILHSIPEISMYLLSFFLIEKIIIDFSAD
jgi:hypothetical protein